MEIEVARESDAGEILTVQRAAYVVEAQRYADPHIPPLTEPLESAGAAGTGWSAPNGSPTGCRSYT